MEVRARDDGARDDGSRDQFSDPFRQQSPVSSSVAYEVCCNVTEAEDHSCGGNQNTFRSA